MHVAGTLSRMTSIVEPAIQGVVAFRRAHAGVYERLLCECACRRRCVVIAPALGRAR